VFYFNVIGSDAALRRWMFRNACSGFIYALSVADQFIKPECIRHFGSWRRDPIYCPGPVDRRRNTAVIFVMEPARCSPAISQGGNPIDSPHSDGRFAEELYVKDPGSSRPQAERATKQILDTPV